MALLSTGISNEVKFLLSGVMRLMFSSAMLLRGGAYYIVVYQTPENWYSPGIHADEGVGYIYLTHVSFSRSMSTPQWHKSKKVKYERYSSIISFQAENAVS